MKIYIPTIKVSSQLIATHVSLILFLIVQGIGFAGYGQTFDSLSVDGQIFVKIKDTSSVFFQNYNGNDSTLRPEILPLKNTYGITKISKPFSNYNYNYCQKTYLLEFNNTSLIQGLINSLTSIGYIEYAENVPIVFTFLTPNDGQFNGGLLNAQNWHLKKIGAEQAWDITTGNASSIIAVIDNEIDISHPDLANKIVSPWDEADNDNDPGPNATLNHGSHCAGLIAAETNNVIPNSGSIASIGYNCSIMPIKATPSAPQTNVNSLDIIACINGINYAVVNGANIINCSWGVFNPNVTNGSITLQNACLNATSNGVLIVAAAGNNGNGATPPFFPQVAFPAGFSTTNNGVISVGATNNNDAKAGFSFYGASVNVCAPGVNIFSTNSLQQITTIPGFDYKSGTSMAAPIVAGLCGLIHSINPLLTPSQIRNCITGTATNIDAINPQFVGFIGAGIVNAPQALLCASNAQNNTASIIASSTTACPNQQITLTGLPIGANGYNWNFSQIPTIISQNGNQIIVTFPNNGTVNVTLTVNTASGVLTANTSLTIGSPFVDFDQRASGAICNGSAQQIDLNFFNTTPPFDYTITNGVNTTSITNATSLMQNYFFNAAMGNNVYTVTVTDVNGCSAQPTFIINNIVSCCQNLIINGDFEQGNTGFTSENVFSNCPLPIGISMHGAYQVIDLNNSVLPNTFYCNPSLMGSPPEQAGVSVGAYNSLRNTMLRIDGRCGPDQTPIGQINLAPLPNNTSGLNGYQMGVSSILWSQNNILVSSNNIYNLDFFMSSDGGSSLFLNMINIEIIDQFNNNILFTSNSFALPSTKLWNQYSYQFQPNINGNIIIRINQVDYFGGSNFDMNIDDISLRSTTNGILNLNITNNCTPSATITPITTILNPIYIFNGVSATPPFSAVTGINTVSIINDPACILTQTASISTSLPTLSPSCLPGTVCLGNTTLLYCPGNFFYSWSNNVPNYSTIIPMVTANYTVTATDVNGCTQTASCSVIVNPIPNILANASALNLCNGDFLTLTGSGGNSYVWSGGAVDGIPFNPPVGVTTYTVTGTSANNCTATSTVTITVTNNLPAPTFTLSNPCIPNASSVSLTVTAPLGAGIQYQLNGGTPQASTLFPNINTAGSYTITAIDNAICSSSVVVNIPSCPFIPCQALPVNPNTVYVTANNSAFTQWPSNNFPSGVPVVFDGVFTVDQNLSMLNNPNIYFTPNSQVILTNGSTLTIDNSRLQGCGSAMWKGIKADLPNEKVAISNSSTLRDMQEGVVIADGAAIDCQNSIFTDNNIGIQFLNTPANYTSPINNGLVLNNEFTSSGNPLMAPFNMQSKSNVGILAAKCKSLQIGELVNGSSNQFHDIFTGIFDLPAPNMSQVLRSYNNKFLNINDDYSAATYPEGALLNNFYTTHKGAGIIGIEYFGGNTSNLRKIEVQSMVDDGGFFNCDKAVVANNISVDASDNIVDNCRGGFLFSLATGQLYNIQRNRISDVFTGIQVIGDPLKVNILNHDAGNQAYINLQTNGMTTGANNMQEWPVAVDIKFATYAHPGSVNVNNNDIFIPGIGGRGVAFALTGSNTAALDNIITFTTTDASAYQGPNMPHLMGFHTFFAVGSRLDCNTVNGLTDPSAWGIRNSQGILLYESRRMEVACNFVNFTHHGLLPFGDCGTTNDRVRGNLFYNHIWGMLFAPSVFGNEGTVGDIGLSQNYDNNNQFWGMYVNTPFNHQVYRWWWVNPTLNKIFTLQPVNSGSNVPFFEYLPQPTPNPLNCNSTCQNTQPQIVQLDSLMNLDIAIEIANDSLNLPVFPEVGEWLARRRLYADLDQDSMARNSNTTLLNFYNTYTTQTIDDLYQTDKAIVSLTDSTSYADTLLFMQRLTSAQAQNQSISSINNYELNEQWINALYMNMLERGSDSISATELMQLESLAKSCPAIAGTAVYKARTLYAKYEPALSYNDFAVCNSAAAFKNGSPFDEMLSFINQTTNEFPDTNKQLSLMTSKDMVSLYPNPATEKVTIAYNFADGSQRTFVLYDILGRELKRVELKANQTNVVLDVSQFMTGLYNYSIYNKGKNEFTGKITITQ